MLRNLLTERFKLTVHHGSKDAPAYELSIAKGGLKMKETADPNAVPQSYPQPGERPGPMKIAIDPDGFPIVPAGRSGMVTAVNHGLQHNTCRACAISDLLPKLGMQLGSALGNDTAVMGRIMDQTGLTGKYDFNLEYAGSVGFGGALQPPALDSQAESGPDLFNALEKQLGLKLEKIKAPLDVLVVDHIEKVPEEN